MSKKKVLLVAENHNLASGFGTYAKNLLERLHASGKYEVAEFAIYMKTSDGKDLPWKVYGNAPEDDEPQEQKDLYNSNANNQFGAWRFDKVVLDFKPDIVLSYRDPWMDMFISKSPLLPYFHWVWMPTVDSDPQKQSWIEGFAKTDAILCYSEFGIKTLEKDAGHLLNIKGCASPGIDPKIYKPYDKKQIRQELGLDPNVNIVGTVMRNQKRKLFPELIKSFAKFLKVAPPEIKDNTYLLLHTSYPEKMGWNLGYHISEEGVGGKVLTTYVCKNCKKWRVDFFRDSLNYCKDCNSISCVMPSVGLGLNVEDLVKVYNIMDLYVQYAICEGFGMPQVEATACGVPIASTNYSAMEDVLQWTKGYPIKIQKMYRELETNAERVFPDNDHLVEIMINHLMLSPEEKAAKSQEVRQATIERYDWDDCAKAWMDYIDTYKPHNLQGVWDNPPTLFNIPEQMPQNLGHEQFVQYLYQDIIHEPDSAYGYEATKLIRDLNIGAIVEHGVIEPVNKDQIFQRYKAMAQNKLVVEKIRSGMATLQNDTFIEMANENDRN
ncbi:MAG: glycosyltransferase [Candidatus Hodarchaeales archaeon]|jgi:glycosyltransferase involved in cell wall biosynthesis